MPSAVPDSAPGAPIPPIPDASGFPPGPSGLGPVGAWRGNAPAYVWARVWTTGIVFGLITIALLGLGALLWWLTGSAWWLVPAAIPAVWGGWLTATEPRRVRAMGYLMRTDDVLFRRGLWFRRVVAVPYGRLQLASVQQGPIDRMAGVAKVRLVTASAGTDAVIPGLALADAEALRDQLVSLAESRRAGL